MPAPLDRPSVKKDIRLYTEDVAFLEPILRNPKNNTTLNEYVRSLVHNAANAQRKKLGLPEI